MSNATIVVADSRTAPAIRTWLATRSSRDELFERPLGVHTLFLISAEIDRSVQGTTFFLGTFWSAERGVVGFGLDGWLAVRDGRGFDAHGMAGEFICVEWHDERRVDVRRDVFSSVGLMHSTGCGYVAVSDSLLILTALRRACGDSVTPNDQAVLARAALNSVGAQQMSTNTYVREISFVPAGKGVAIELDRLQARVEGISLTERIRSSQAGDLRLRDSAAFICGAIRAVMTVPGWQLSLSLSGGYDSRLLLAAALRTRQMDRLEVRSSNSTRAHRSDFAIAAQLSSTFGFAINSGTATPRALPVERHVDAVPAWASTLLGIYDRLLPRLAVDTAPAGSSMSGVGAEILKGNWGWMSIPDFVSPVSDRMASDRFEAYLAEIELGMAAIGADPEWADATEFFYVGYRNGLHSAAHLTNHMLGFRPLQHLEMASLGHMRTDGGPFDEGRGEATFAGSYAAVVDLLCMMHPELAVFPYDTDAKSIPLSTVKQRLDIHGGPLSDDEIQEVEVHGDPLEVPCGPSRLGRAVAEEYGFGIGLNPAEVLALAESFAGAFSNSLLNDVQDEMIRKARYAIVKKNRPLDSAGFHLSKALSFGLWR